MSQSLIENCKSQIVLAIDTATEALVLGLGTRDRVLASHFTIAGRHHLELHTVAIRDLFKKAGLKYADAAGIIVGLGPGSLIGARVGVVAAKTLAQVLNVSLIGISTIKVIEAGPSKKIGEKLYPTPEALLKLGFDKLKKGQVSSIYELEPIYKRGPL